MGWEDGVERCLVVLLGFLLGVGLRFAAGAGTLVPWEGWEVDFISAIGVVGLCLCCRWNTGVSVLDGERRCRLDGQGVVALVGLGGWRGIERLWSRG